MRGEPRNLDGCRTWAMISEKRPPDVVELVLLIDVGKIASHLDDVAERGVACVQGLFHVPGYWTAATIARIG